MIVPVAPSRLVARAAWGPSRPRLGAEQRRWPGARNDRDGPAVGQRRNGWGERGCEVRAFRVVGVVGVRRDTDPVSAGGAGKRGVASRYQSACASAQHAVIEVVAFYPGSLDAQKARGGAVDRSPKEQKKHQEKKHDRQRIPPRRREENACVIVMLATAVVALRSGHRCPKTWGYPGAGSTGRDR